MLVLELDEKEQISNEHSYLHIREVNATRLQEAQYQQQEELVRRYRDLTSLLLR